MYLISCVFASTTQVSVVYIMALPWCQVLCIDSAVFIDGERYSAGLTICYNIFVLVFCQTTLPDFSKPEFSVVRQHEEFMWLHDRFEENEEYAGIVVSICGSQYLLR